jgi:hypothetical protein
MVLTSCNKKVSPNEAALAPSPGKIAYVNVSEDLLQQLTYAQPARYWSHVLVDNGDTSYGVNGRPLNSTFAFFNAEYPTQYPTDRFNITQDQPWLRYSSIDAGKHQFILTDTGHHAVIKSTFEVTANEPITLFFADSLGSYHAFPVKDAIQPAAGKTGLRFIDLSPDAGKVFFTINNETATGFPDTFQFGKISSFVTYNRSARDTMRLRFYQAGDSSTVLARSTLYTEPGHGYTILLTGYLQYASYSNPVTGQYMGISPNLRVMLYKNY